MPNMIDYLKWRGDLPLTSVPFCEPDSLILSYLSYVNLDDIAPGPDDPLITIEQASHNFFERYCEQDLKKDRSFIRMAPYIMKEMALTRRFSSALIGKYVNIIDAEHSLQFCAMEVQLEDDTSYIAFRGTDDTIVGWKEDFNLSNGIVPAQKKSVEYLNNVGGRIAHGLRLGGHSKGGNLCIYAGAKCSAHIQDKIIHIHSNDGPGFDKSFFSDPGYLNIKNKIGRIVPECSIIGMLLCHDIPPVIIDSSQKGMMQHDGMSWEIMGNDFIETKTLNSKTQVFNEILSTWINETDEDSRESLIENLFSILEASGAKTLTQIQKSNFKEIMMMMRQLEHVEPEAKKTLDTLIDNLIAHAKELL